MKLRVRLATVLRHRPKLVQKFFHEAAVFYAQFSPDGRYVLAASNDGTARVWDIKTGAAVGRPLSHRSNVKRAAFSSDGGRIVTASDDCSARVWDAETDQPITPPLEHQGPVTLAVFTPDGCRVRTLLAAACRAGWVRRPIGRRRQVGGDPRLDAADEVEHMRPAGFGELDGRSGNVVPNAGTGPHREVS